MRLESVVIVQPFKSKIGKNLSCTIWVGRSECVYKHSNVLGFKTKITEGDMFVQAVQFFTQKCEAH